MKTTVLKTLLMVILLCVFVAGCEKSGSQQQPAVDKASAFTLENYDGKEVSLSDYEGKFVVLQWFNYECPYVKYHYDQTNTFADLVEKYKDKNVAWIAINSTKHLTTEENKSFAEKHNISFPILDDRQGKVGRAYGAKTTPHMFIVDPEGFIVYNGALDNAPRGKLEEGAEPVNYVDKALNELISGQTVSISQTDPYGCSVKYAN